MTQQARVEDDGALDAGRAPEDLSQVAVGGRWRSSGRTLTESELGLACMLSTDWHPIHADAAFAAASPLGQRVFQGGYGVLLALGLATRYPAVGTRQALALGTESWRFAAPLFIGDTVHVEVEITGLRRTSDGKRIVVQKQVRLVTDSGKIAQEGSVTSLVHLSAAHGDYDKIGDTQ
jgi:acyl dehydratase